MKSANPFLASLLAASVLTANGQVPDTLLHSIPGPTGGLQGGAALGSSVAVDESSGLSVAGAPNDDTGGQDSGVVKVFDTATGALLHLIPNPGSSPVSSDNFGESVAISDTKIIVARPMMIQVCKMPEARMCTTSAAARRRYR